jgi:predicted membrane-bound spermidine synthase
MVAAQASPRANEPVRINSSVSMSQPFGRQDLVLLDSRQASRVFVVCAAFLLLGAAAGLNTWPGQKFTPYVQDANAGEILFGFQTFAVFFVALFWGARPPRNLKIAVLTGWVACSALLASAVADARSMLWPSPTAGSLVLFFVATLAAPSLLATLWRVVMPASEDAGLLGRLRWLVLLSVLFIFVPQPLLSLTATLHPHTFDLHALHFDRAAGLDITPSVVSLVDRVAGLPQLVALAYGITPLVFLMVPLRQLTGKPDHVASALKLWVVMTACATLAYQVFPITGPKYVFGEDAFVGALDPARAHAVRMAEVMPYPRNGMPSMHFGWLLAACIVWWQSGTRAWSRALMVAVTVLTAIATLYLGEHYTVDLIVAVPFVLAALAASTTGVPWSSASKKLAVATGFGCWLIWVVLLRSGVGLFIDRPFWSHVMIGATMVVVGAQVRWIRRFPLAAAASVAVLARSTQTRPDDDAGNIARRFAAMFFVSGAAALVYQVLFAKQLALVFGSTATATFTVLATFLGGMALGSLIGGHWAQRVGRPLVVYAFIELGIAVYCVLTPHLFKEVQALYVAVGTGAPPDAAALLVLRVLLGAAVLLLPTALMGVTLPLLARALGPESDRMGPRVAWLYFANTAGAAIGALLAAYWVIPALGAYRTTLVAALLNLLVALAALELAKRFVAPSADVAGAGAGAGVRARSTAGNAAAVRAVALVALGLCGALSLGLEVVYVHMLSIVAGNSVYAFGLMVATFLCGLAIGGESARRYLNLESADAAFGLTLSLLGLSTAVTLGAWAWNMIPPYFATFANYPLARTFGAREAIRGLVCATVMIPPTVFIGAAYVLSMDMLMESARRSKIGALGIGAAMNTAGNIAGVLLFGFVLLPWLGGLGSSRAIAAGAWLLGLVALLVASRMRMRMALVSAVAALVVLIHGTTMRLDYEALSSGANVYFSPQMWGKVVDHAESIDGGLTTVAQRDSPPPTTKTLLTNGKFQGNDAIGGEMQAQIGFALAPLLHQDLRGSALVIGYGTGATARVLHDAGFEKVDIAELSGDVVRMSDRHFVAVNANVSSQPGVELHVTDGRNFLLLSDKRYDVLSIEISSIWFAGAASLYNKEFYELVRSRLSPAGVLQQWVQLHRLAPLDILSIIGTVRSEFRYVSLYMIGAQGIIVATNDRERAAPRGSAIELLRQSPKLLAVRRIAERDVSDLPHDRLLVPESVDRLIAAFGNEPSLWWSTDDNLRLEYSTPKANANDAEKSMRFNIQMLAGFR